MPQNNLHARFWSKVNKDGPTQPHMTTPCWEWTRAKGLRGYGRFGVSGIAKRAHRVSYEMENGPIPDGLFVCHACDLPRCVRPDHLWLGTDADNCRDRQMKGRTRIAPCLGEAHGRSKLTNDEVQRIRNMRSAGASVASLASEFAVSQANVYRVVNRELWGHL